MFDGSPPPANPYRTPQPSSIAHAAKTLERTPNRRIERRDLLYTLDGEGEGAPGFLAPVLYDVTTTLDPFDDATVTNPLEANERVATKGEAPSYRLSNVDTQELAVNAGRRVAQRGKCDSTQRRPEKRRRRNEAAGQPRARNIKGVGNEYGRAATEASTQKQVEASAVRAGDACDTFSTARDISIDELPIEYDLPMHSR
jgi:hypothetical protein